MQEKCLWKWKTLQDKIIIFSVKILKWSNSFHWPPFPFQYLLLGIFGFHKSGPNHKPTFLNSSQKLISKYRPGQRCIKTFTLWLAQIKLVYFFVYQKFTVTSFRMEIRGKWVEFFSRENFYGKYNDFVWQRLTFSQTFVLHFIYTNFVNLGEKNWASFISSQWATRWAINYSLSFRFLVPKLLLIW